MNIEVVNNRSKDFDIVVSDDAGLVDLDGMSLDFHAKHSFKDPDPPVITRALTLKDQNTDEGEATLHLLPASTGLLDPTRTHVLFFQITLTDGTDKYVVESGKLTVLPVVDQ